eukprot:7006800-Prymnesium_polylepis.1
MRDDHLRDAQARRDDIERRLHDLFGRVVERRRRLVEQQHRRLLDQRPRDRNALLLAAAQPVAKVADLRPKAVGELGGNEVERVRHPRRLLHLRICRARLAVPDVLGDISEKPAQTPCVAREQGICAHWTAATPWLTPQYGRPVCTQQRRSQRRFLPDEPQLAAQPREVERADVDAVEAEGAVLRVVEALEQRDDRRLARAARADEATR